MKSRILLLAITVALTASMAAGLPNETYSVDTDAVCVMAATEPVINATSYNIALGVTRDYIIHLMALLVNRLTLPSM